MEGGERVDVDEPTPLNWIRDKINWVNAPKSVGGGGGS
jgi:hypothetical protein